MKKSLPILLLCFCFTLSTQAQDVPEKQQAMISKITASWCINCGTWGWNLFSGLVEDNSSDALVMAVHYSGNLINPTATALRNNLDATGQPLFFLGNENQFATNGNSSSKRTEIKNKVADLASQAPLANTGLLAMLSGTELTVTTNTRFFQPANGAYYMALYIIEDGVVSPQTGQNGNPSHKQVLRASVTTDAFGTLLMDGNIASGMEFSNSHSISLNPSWNTSRLKVAAVIWKKEGNTYNFVNTNATSDLTVANNNELEVSSDQMMLLPTIGQDNIQIKLDMIKSSEQAHLRVYNLKGQLLHTIYSGSLKQGPQQFELLRNKVGGTGLYLVTLATEHGLVSKKLIFN